MVFMIWNNNALVFGTDDNKEHRLAINHLLLFYVYKMHFGFLLMDISDVYQCCRQYCTFKRAAKEIRFYCYPNCCYMTFFWNIYYFHGSTKRIRYTKQIILNPKGTRLFLFAIFITVNSSTKFWQTFNFDTGICFETPRSNFTARINFKDWQRISATIT